jgi:hypothetical protein
MTNGYGRHAYHQTFNIFVIYFGFFGKHFMTIGEPSENLQYFLELQKQTSKKKMSLFKEKKKHLDPLAFKFHIFLISCLF